VLAFTRVSGDSRIFAAFNLSSEAKQIVVKSPARLRQLESIGALAGELQGERLTLPAHGVVFATY
jgi:hypothetical protein